jgi:threonine/homoserine/homoserine lactone efflux protein
MTTALASGILLGISCGLAPGPLMALVLAQTLRYGAREGCKVALVPLLTDAPIILLALVLAAKLSALQMWLGVLSVAGGAFVLYLAVDTFRAERPNAGAGDAPSRSWGKGVLVNLLSPHPWLFWLTAGAATLAKAMAESWLAAAAFLAGFYLLLVGSKALLAVAAARSRGFLAGQAYRLIMRTLGLLLAGFAVLLLREGFRHLTAT